MIINSADLDLKFKDKKILIVGAGVTGTALIKTLSNYDLYVTDNNLDKISNSELKKSEFRFDVVNPDQDWVLRVLDFDVIIPSPGIPKAHEIIRAAMEAGLEILSEIEVGYLAAHIPIIAITGTNGKTTVTTLVNRVLNEANMSSVACGNIGTSLIESVAEDIAKDFYVTEVSSFQLEFTKSFKPRVAAWLNFSEDHLDWHPDLADYANAKSKIWKNQGQSDIAVLNVDDPVVTDSFTRFMRDKGANVPEVVSFGLKRGNFHVEDGNLVCFDFLESKKLINLIPISSLKRSSNIDILNFLAVLAICIPLGVQPETAAKVICEFTGLPHRIEFVLEERGVTWVNDSKATTPASVVAALESLHDVVLIMGGKDKGFNFDPIESMLDRIKAFVLIGDLQVKLNQTFSDLGRPIRLADSMESAVKAAYELAETGSTILLSPGGTSFDWYRDYKHRGDDFKSHVQKLVSENSND